MRQQDDENASCSTQLILVRRERAREREQKEHEEEHELRAAHCQLQRTRFGQKSHKARLQRSQMTGAHYCKKSSQMRSKEAASLALINFKCQNLFGSMRRKLFPFFGTQRQCLLLVASLCLLLALALNGAQAASAQSSEQASSSSSSSSSSSPSSAASAAPTPKQAASKQEASGKLQPSKQVVQSRAGLIAPSAAAPLDDYGQPTALDESGELDVLASQQQIPTAQLMSAAGHFVPENFFLPGGSIPAAFYQQHPQQLQQRLQQQQAQQSQQERAIAEALQQVAAATIIARHAAVVGPPQSATSARHGRAALLAAAPLDLLMAAASEQQQQQQPASSSSPESTIGAQAQQQQQQKQQQQQQHLAASALLDYNGYQLTTQPDPRDSAPHVDLLEFLNGGHASATHSQQQATLAALQQQLIYEQQLAALAAAHQQQHNNHYHHHGGQQQQQNSYSSGEQQQIDQMSALASQQQQQQQEEEHYTMGSGNVGPDYQLIGGQQDYDNKLEASSHKQQQQQQQRPYGLPTKSSSREPSGMLKPLGNPKTVSSPIIDFVANNLPKQSGFEKLAEKLPSSGSQAPTVFSFASQKDPVGDKAKAISSKKRNVMRQAEQLAKLAIKSINDKFGTNLGEQTDIPFLLSTLGPLGLAQNLLLDPTLLVTLLNTAEKTYFSDVLPGPAKAVVRPVLNIFRVPNKKRDKANLLNIISYLASGGQTATNAPLKHRQFGIEKNNNKKTRR